MLSLGWRGERLAERLAEEVNLCAERGLWLVLHGLCHAPRDWPPRAASLLQRVLTHGGAVHGDASGNVQLRPRYSQPALSGSVVYGGYITRRQDLEVVESIVKHCLPSHRPGGALHAGSSSFSPSELGFFTEPEPSNFGLCDGAKEKDARHRSHQATEQLRMCTSDNWPMPASHPGPKRRWLPRLAVDSHSEYLGGYACMAEEPGQTEDETHTGLASFVEGTRPSLKSFFRSELEDFRLHAMAPFEGAWSLRSEDGWKRSVCPLVEEDDEEDEAAPSWALGGCRELETEPVVRLLSRQSELLSAYAATDHVVSYNLAALSRPETFLISLMRIAAYKEKTLPHRCVLHAQVLSGFVAPDAAPAEGVYLTGLHLHNALWDTRFGALQETVSAQPCAMPLVWLRCATLTQAKSNSSGGSWTVGAAWKTRAEVDALIVKVWSDGTRESRHHQDPWAGTLHATTATASNTSSELPEGRRAQSTKCHRQRMEGRFQNNQRPMERTTSRSAGSLGRKGTACSGETATARLFPVYGCPLHVLSPCRGSPAGSHVVAYVELPSMVDPAVCAQRRVHLTCSLE
ncbi:unnamed protein product [Lampetra planeri]